MHTELNVHLRAFHIRVSDPTYGERGEVIVLDKSQLQAAQLVGQSSKELIDRICEKAGVSVLEIGKAEKCTVTLNLEELYQSISVTGKREIEKSRSTVGTVERDMGTNFAGQVPKFDFTTSGSKKPEFVLLRSRIDDDRGECHV